jgi:ATP-dependent RNA helicase RhlE
MSFDSLGLSDPILKAIAEKGYSTPSPIQAKAIPPVLEGRDVMAAAQTGTGKTAGFTLPILHLLSSGEPAKPNQARALILTPTRELAAQIQESVALYGRYLPLKSTVVFGGVKINPQMMKLRKGADILVATPGRLLDLHNQNAVRFDQLEVLVLDEADRMLDMGFIHDIRRILKVLPSKRQNLMFSATFSDDIRKLANSIVNNPVQVSVAPPNTTAEKVEQRVHPVDKKDKTNLLIKLIKDNSWYQVLVFSRTKHGANKITKLLEKAGINAAAIHGNKSQGARTKALAEFKNGKIQILVATDIAARGLDINELPQVVNFDLPNVPEDYVHRIGRTARAGKEGCAVSLVSADEHKQLMDIERLIKTKLQRVYVDGFEPDHDVPESRANQRPSQQRHKPNKPKQGNNSGNRSSNGRRGGSGNQGNKGNQENNGNQKSAKQGGQPENQGNRNKKPSNNVWKKRNTNPIRNQAK